MLLRKVLLAAALVAPLVLNPALVSAQQGLDRAAVAAARADAVGAGSKSLSAKGLPGGIAKRFEGQTLPPGMRRTRATPTAPPPPPVPPVPDTECTTEVVFVNGAFMLKGCDGSLTPILGTP